MRGTILLGYVSSVLMITAVAACAQEGSAVDPYQRGAGAYFAGRTDQAEKYLSQAIEASPDDPRAYYLRGLNRLRTGNRQGARADLSEGARLEARGGTSSAQVDRSLAGVQGSARLTLERIRREARESRRMAARQERAEARKRAREEREQRVLRTTYQFPIEALASRLSVEQARQLARQQLDSDDMVVTGSPPANDSSANRGAAGPGNAAASDPFADDNNQGEVLDAPADSNQARSSESQDVEVPAAARGSMTASGLFGLFRGPGERAAERVGETFDSAKQALGQAPIPGGGGPAGGNAPFGQGAPPAGGEAGQFGPPGGQDGQPNPFAPSDDPFQQFGEEPADPEESPF